MDLGPHANSPYFSLNQAVTLRREGKTEEAKKMLEEAMKDPNNIDAEIEYACMRPSAQEAIKVLVESEKKGALSAASEAQTSHIHSSESYAH